MKRLVAAVAALVVALPAAAQSPCKPEPKAACEKASMRGARLAGMDLSAANFAGANLQNARAAGARFANANLQGADLDSADLAGADFTGADLRNANLTGAEVAGVKWDGANLTGAMFPAGRGNYGDAQGRRCGDGSIGTCK